MESFEPDNLATRLFGNQRSTRYLVTTWAFIIGSGAHLWLEDAAQDDWLVANVIYVVGLVLLALRSYFIGWTLSAIGVAIPLFFLRDQLTQSMLLLVWSSLFIVFEFSRLFWVRRPHIERRLLSTVGWTGAATYLVASVHKINRDFLDPTTSCAVYGIDKLEHYYSLPVTTIDGALNGWLPLFAIAIESSIALLYIARQKRFAWIAAVVFHIPLTVTMAPAFAFVMLTGHVAMANDLELKWFGTNVRRIGIPLGTLAAVITAASVALHGSIPEWSMIPKEWLLWFLLLCLVIAPRVPVEQRHQPGPFWIVVALFVLHGLTPYLGVQYQHTAAMLSNLRIDEGCWNSVIFPESMRLSDDYVRVDEAYFKEPGHNEKYEEIVRSQLWNPPQIRQMRRNWCRDQNRPFHLAGTYRGESFVIEDLCSQESVWPFEGDGVFGTEIFGDYLRFQKNLERECPQACIH